MAGRPSQGRYLAAHALFQVQRRCDVVRMYVGVQRVPQPKPKHLERLKVAIDGIDDGVNQQRLAGRLAIEQVGVGA